jgi:RNA polymerase sigma-70 factor (ECF subfamily)
VTVSQHDPFAVALAAQVPALRRYAVALVRDGAAADDLVQDCIERALRQAEKLEDIQRIGGWLRTILHNLHVDDVRRRRRRGVTVDITDASATLASPARDPGLLIDFDRAMGQLSFEHRQVLLLVGLEGLNYREVAEELAIPIGTVMSRLARGREKLREAMEEKNPQPTSRTDEPNHVREP